jgi:hypothetical protein
MINHLDLYQKNISKMASANNESSIPSLSAPVLPRRKDGQTYIDGLPQLFVGQNWPLVAIAIG